MFSYFASVKRFFCLFLFLSLFGCRTEDKDLPPNMIPRAQMVQILADIHTAEAQIEGQIIYPDTAQMTFNYSQEQILVRHGVTKEQFRDTYRYYITHVKSMDKLYEIIIDTLSVRESKAKAAAGVTDTLRAQDPVPYQAPPMQQQTY